MDDETRHLSELRNARLDRLRQLELQSARFGNETPPHITIEITAQRTALGMVESALGSSAPADVVESLGPIGRFQSLHREIKLLRQRDDERGVDLAGQLSSLSSELRIYARLFAIWLFVISILLIISAVVLFLAIR